MFFIKDCISGQNKNIERNEKSNILLYLFARVFILIETKNIGLITSSKPEIIKTSKDGDSGSLFQVSPKPHLSSMILDYNNFSPWQ